MRLRKSSTAFRPRRFAKSDKVFCHHANASALPSSLIFFLYRLIQSLASVWRKVSSINKRCSDDRLAKFFAVFESGEDAVGNFSVFIIHFKTALQRHASFALAAFYRFFAIDA